MSGDSGKNAFDEVFRIAQFLSKGGKEVRSQSDSGLRGYLIA